MIGRYLITTADERSWKFDRPVLFLGEWCRLYDRKKIWQNMDAAVAEPYGLDTGQKEHDLAYVQEISSKLLSELADALNLFHGTHHGLRYWNIVLGHWLQRYVTVILNRYFTLEQALSNHEVSGTTIFDSTAYSLATIDSNSFLWACSEDIWNHVLYSKILNYWGTAKVELDFIPLQSTTFFFNKSINLNLAQSTSFKAFVLGAVNKFFNIFSKKNDAFIINSYLSRREEIELQISLGQCPQLWKSPTLKDVVPNPEKRRQLSIDVKSYTGFERFVRSHLNEMIPICYLEGYQQLVRQTKSLPWPTEPSFIFTSNNFAMDETFKVWTAQKVEEGRPYFVGQHGSNYGTLLGSQHWPELVTCDKFLTWGWTDDNHKNIPAFVFKVAGHKHLNRASNGGLLLIEVHPPHLAETFDSYFEFGLYQEEQFRFVEALPQTIQQKLTVLLHPGYRDFKWSDEQRWKDRSPQTHLQTSPMPIGKKIAQNRLIVHSYDSTGILETLVLNTPTLCYWHGGLEHLLPSAKPYYQMLKDVGIIAETPERAAELVCQHWDNIDEWWKSEKVQEARNIFCQRYARMEKRPIRILKNLLTQNNVGILSNMRRSA